MKLFRIWVLATLPLALMACDDDGLDEGPLDREPEVEEVMDDAAPPVTVVDPAPMAVATAQTFPMMALAGSGVAGQATLMPRDNQTEITVRLTGLPAGDRPGHIHTGTCDNVGSVETPLATITPGADGAGTMTATVLQSADMLMHEPRVIAYHGSSGAPIVCGAIPTMAM